MKIEFLHGTENDLDDIIKIESEAYKKISKNNLSKRTFKEIKMFYEQCPDGFFVSKCNDENVGFIFTRNWGTMGWSGPSAIYPDFQKMGIGKKLLDMSSNFLNINKCNYYGFETIPQNLNIYTRCNSIPTTPTLIMKKKLKLASLESSKKDLIIRKAKFKSDYENIYNFAEKIIHGIDLANEITLGELYLNYNVFLINYNDYLNGFFITKLNDKNSLYIPIIILSLNHGLKFKDYISLIERYFYENKISSLTYPINCSNIKLVLFMKEHGYKSVAYSLRMINDKSKEFNPNNGVFLYLWGT